MSDGISVYTYNGAMLKLIPVIALLLFPVSLLAGPASAEPARCLEMAPLVDDQVDLVSWLLKEGESLKKAGCWLTHVRLGEQALKEAAKKHRLVDRTRLAIQLASSHFYLGQYQQAKALAEEARVSADRQFLWKELIESLYLLSACERVAGHPDAVKLAKEALGILEKKVPDQLFLRAKVLYNLGAAYSDGEDKDLPRARAALQEANSIYRQLDQPYDVVRTGLRLARVDYLKKNYASAFKEAKSLEPLLSDPRSHMLYHYQLGKILHRQKKWSQARSEAQQALSYARSLEARADQDRCEKLLEAIRSKTFVD